MFRAFCLEETGAVVSIEIILIITIAVLSLIVGWSEVAHAVNQELDDISNAVGKFNQSYFYVGFQSISTICRPGQFKSYYLGSTFIDNVDVCDSCNGTSQIACCSAMGGGGGVGVGNVGVGGGIIVGG